MLSCIEKTSGNATYTVKTYDNVVGKDIHVADLSSFGKKMLSLQFDQKTVFPARDKLPSQDKYQPDYIMEAGKNPGLGVRSIHEKGIIGKGVTVAIIDMPLKSVNHPEYAGKIITYKDFSEKPDNNIHGSGVTSLLVGEWTGTAPGAKLYYAAVPPVFDATYYANALDWIVETNKKLPDGEKIRVVSISSSPTPSNEQWTNGEKYLESVKRATDAGILVLDCSENGIIGPCGYDFDNPEDVSLCKPGFLQYPDWNNKNDILVPVQYRTVAEEYDVKGYYSYLYYGDAGLSWGIPYAAGVLAMGWQVKPGLTPDEITDILFNTAYVDSNGYKYINPTAFIDQLSSME